MAAAAANSPVQAPGADARPLAVSLGDPAGIGPDIVIEAFRARHRLELPAFVVYGDPRTLAARAELLGAALDLAEVASPAAAGAAFARGHLPVIVLRQPRATIAGEPDAGNGAAVIAAIEQATADVQAGRASALVTCPIAKHVLYAAGFGYPGHTEFLAALAERAAPGTRVQAVMMLAGELLRVVPLTIHIPVAAVPGAVTGALIISTARILAAALTRDFGIARPRIAVAGLNPHAGENGSIGREDADIVAPALAQLRAEGLAVTGPHSADTLFHAAARAGYDAVLAMYHDQALIPIKTLAFDEAVNVTLGLPFVRTSPDHGTAFDIAGSGRARATSFVAALHMADQMARRRQVTA